MSEITFLAEVGPVLPKIGHFFHFPKDFALNVLGEHFFYICFRAALGQTIGMAPALGNGPKKRPTKVSNYSTLSPCRNPKRPNAVFWRVDAPRPAVVGPAPRHCQPRHSADDPLDPLCRPRGPAGRVELLRVGQGCWGQLVSGGVPLHIMDDVLIAKKIPAR